MALRMIEIRDDGPVVHSILAAADRSRYRSVYLPQLRGETPRTGVFGTIGRKVRLAVLDFGRSENSIHGCLADAELASDGGSGGTFGG